VSNTTRPGLTRGRPYQGEGARVVSRGLREHRAFALLDDPGLGKSLQALLAMFELSVRRTCIVSPAGARRVWAGEILKWFPAWVDRIVIIEPGNEPAGREIEADDAIVLVSFDALSLKAGSWETRLGRLAWDLLIIDEAHYCKGWSNRTRALYGNKGSNEGLQASAEYVLLLSGTLAPNHCGELWQHLRTFWPQTLRSPSWPDTPMPEEVFQEYVTVWRQTRFGRQITGSQNVKWLRERLKRYVLRRTKQQVLPELPPMVEQDVPLGVSPAVVRNTLTQGSRALERQLHKLGDERLWHHLRAPPSGAHPDDSTLPLATLRRELGELKVQGVVEWINERLDCGIGKLVVFGWHVDALERLHGLLARFNPVIITGKTHPENRAHLIRRFQHDDTVRVFVGQILAAGTAITLTAASEVVIFEPSWVPGENRQAADRVHRLGQHANVICTYLYLPETLDERILRIMRRKAAEISDLISTTNTSGEEAHVVSA
jgi:SWI/SNF-related matrix-associated actin-dependent regulator of chromatin subfamily A-like protein 1